VGRKEETNKGGIVVTSGSTRTMPISEPEQKSSDLFHVVGFIEAEVKSGAISRSLEISEEGFKGFSSA
jgi:hypothetical protein